jgi:hypothetical protein
MQIPSGDLAGRFMYDLQGTNADKIKKLGLGSNTTLRDDEFLFTIVEDPGDTVWSTYACLHRHLTNHFPSGYQGHIFVKRAPEKLLLIRRKNGNTHQAHYDQVTLPNKNIKAAGKIGKNQPTEMFRDIAKRCVFNHAWRFTVRSARRSGISQMSKRGVNQAVLNRKARHSNVATNDLYNDPHCSSLAHAATALHYRGPVGKLLIVDDR